MGFKKLNLRSNVIEKVLLKFWRLKKTFFSKQSTLSFLLKIKNRNYQIKNKKASRFFYLLERRVKLVFRRLWILRITKLITIETLIKSGEILINNNPITNPNFLVPYSSILSLEEYNNKGLGLKKVKKKLTIYRSLMKSIIIKKLRPIFYNHIMNSTLKPKLKTLKISSIFSKSRVQNFLGGLPQGLLINFRKGTETNFQKLSLKRVIAGSPYKVFYEKIKKKKNKKPFFIDKKFINISKYKKYLKYNFNNKNKKN